MEYYHDKLFLSKVITLALEARKKKTNFANDTEDCQQLKKYGQLENKFMNIAMYLHDELIKEDD